MDPKKVSSILQWSVPTNVQELQSFLDFINKDRRYIPGICLVSSTSQ